MASITQLARGTVRGLQSFVPQKKGGVLILAYHLVQGGTHFRVDLPATSFRRHLEYLKAHARPVSLQTAVTQLESRETDDFDITSVVLTFDDAYLNFYTTAWPLLQEYQIPCTLYVPVHFVEGKISAPLQGASLPPCSWQQIREMTGSGLVSIGSHTLSHVNLRETSAADARREIVDSKKELQQKLGVPNSSFAYPKAFWSSKVDPFVRATYDNAVVAGGSKLQRKNWERYRLSRMPLRSDMEDLTPIINSSIWLEERMASIIRPFIHNSKARNSW